MAGKIISGYSLYFAVTVLYPWYGFQLALMTYDRHFTESCLAVLYFLLYYMRFLTWCQFLMAPPVNLSCMSYLYHGHLGRIFWTDAIRKAPCICDPEVWPGIFLYWPPSWSKELFWHYVRISVAPFWHSVNIFCSGIFQTLFRNISNPCSRLKISLPDDLWSDTYLEYIIF